MGGGSLDPATGYWSQGAYNADDIARAAVVFVRAAVQGPAVRRPGSPTVAGPSPRRGSCCGR